MLKTVEVLWKYNTETSCLNLDNKKYCHLQQRYCNPNPNTANQSKQPIRSPTYTPAWMPSKEKEGCNVVSRLFDLYSIIKHIQHGTVSIESMETQIWYVRVLTPTKSQQASTGDDDVMTWRASRWGKSSFRKSFQTYNTFPHTIELMTMAESLSVDQMTSSTTFSSSEDNSSTPSSSQSLSSSS